MQQDTRLDYVLRVVSLSGLSLPAFWLGLLILMASVALFGTMPIFNPNPQRLLDEAVAIYCVPAVAVGFRSSALIDAAHPLLDAGGAAPGLHPHRARQGRLRDARSIIATRCGTPCCPSSP